ncbi:MAG TPA: hypothetical protein VKT80_00690, partial [Chloroflexota bacterium]|nr:hypothetical protein [Chloroflexota bacterium]
MDAGRSTDAPDDWSADTGAEPGLDSRADEDAIGVFDRSVKDTGIGPADVRIDVPLDCECQNLASCCRQSAQIDNGVACNADVARGNEDACRTAILQGKYGCLALGFVPQCSSSDVALCPATTTRCAACLTAIRHCGPAIQCVSDPTCRSVWDSVVACDEAGRPFFECFQLLSSKGNVPGELILLGAQCVDTCQ